MAKVRKLKTYMSGVYHRVPANPAPGQPARLVPLPGEEEQQFLLDELLGGGIVIPDSAKEKPQRAKVIALGTGKKDDDGKTIPFEVKKGNIVLMSKYGGTDVKIEDKEYKILNADDVLAILED